MTIARDHDVVGLEIAMHDPGYLSSFRNSELQHAAEGLAKAHAARSRPPVRVQRIQHTLWRAIPASFNLYRVSRRQHELSGFLFHLPHVLS